MKRTIGVVAAMLLAVPGVSIASSVFEVELSVCTEALCGVVGAAVLDEGSVEVGDEGEVQVELHRGLPEVALCLEYRPVIGDEHLLVGDFDGWLEHAETDLAKSPVGARAMYVYVGRSAGVPELANDAYSRLAVSLKRAKLEPVIFELFGPGRPLGDFEMLRGPWLWFYGILP